MDDNEWAELNLPKPVMKAMRAELQSLILSAEGHLMDQSNIEGDCPDMFEPGEEELKQSINPQDERVASR